MCPHQFRILIVSAYIGLWTMIPRIYRLPLYRCFTSGTHCRGGLSPNSWARNTALKWKSLFPSCTAWKPTQLYNPFIGMYSPFQPRKLLTLWWQNVDMSLWFHGRHRLDRSTSDKHDITLKRIWLSALLAAPVNWQIKCWLLLRTKSVIKPLTSRNEMKNREVNMSMSIENF